MTITFDNPYAIKIRDKCIEEDKIPAENKEALIKIREEIEDLRQKSHDFTFNKIEELSKKVDELKETKKELTSAPNTTNDEKKALINKVANLYKESLQLMFTFREIRQQLKDDK